MPTPICLAPQCDYPAHGGYLCSTCVATLRRDLRAVPDLIEDLEVTITKQDRLSDPSGRKSDEHPLPLKLGPMEAKRDLAATLHTWVVHVATRADLMPLPPPLTTPNDPDRLAQLLDQNLDYIQSDERGGDLADEIGYAVIQAQRAVDKPLQLQYVGPCEECGGDLYAHPKATHVECRNCSHPPYNVAERRRWLLERAEDQLLTATELSRALPGLLQAPLTAATIRGWARWGKITPHPPLPHKPNDPVYRVGDVITHLNEVRRGDKAS